MTLPSLTTLTAARPAFNVGGADEPGLSLALLRMSITEHTEGMYRCEAHFGNLGPAGDSPGFLYFDRRLFDFGKPLIVRFGRVTVFEGRITALEAVFPEGRPPELGILAEDRLQDLRMTRRTRSFADISDSDLVRQIANDHGLTPEVEISGPTHKVLAQVNQSDLAFLRERARAVDGELWMEGSRLMVKDRARRASQPVPLGYGNELREFTVLADLAGQCTSVRVSGWDVDSKQGILHEAGSSTVSGELGNDTGGTELLSFALGERKQSVAHTVPHTANEAQAQAESMYRKAARNFVTGRGVAQPDSRLRAGAGVGLTGLGPLFSGNYFLVEVRHVFDGERGMRTEFSAHRPGLGKP